MKINYDKIADAMYVTLRGGKIAKSVELEDRLIADIDRKGNILGIEILDAGNSIQKYAKKGVPVSIANGIPAAA